MTEPDALPDQDAPRDDDARGDDVSDPVVAESGLPDEAPDGTPFAADAERRRRSTLQLTAGVLVFLAASLAALAAAGSLGVTGVLIAALIEAAAVSWIYRWCEA